MVLKTKKNDKLYRILGDLAKRCGGSLGYLKNILSTTVEVFVRQDDAIKFV